MQLIPDAGRIARTSYSMWASYLGLTALILPEVLFRFWGLDTNPAIWWWSGVGLILFGTFGRMIQQKGERSVGRLLLLVIMAVALVALWVSPVIAQPVSAKAFAGEALPLVARWEGKSNTAYLDRIASPPVWTICHGETRGVKQGDYRTDAQCAEMLRVGLLEYRDKLHRYFTGTTILNRLTPKRDAAYVSVAWNVGISGLGKSTATRRLNAGDIAGGCQALTWWNKAGQRVIRGLVNRRADDFGLCMAGL